MHIKKSKTVLIFPRSKLYFFIKQIMRKIIMSNHLTKYRTGLDLVDQLREEFNSWLAPWNEQFSREVVQTLTDWSPAADIQDEGDHFIIHADIPGVESKNIEINMENNVLTLQGERESHSRENKKNYLRVERSQGKFMRRFVLPETVDVERISAKNKEGVLEIILPKTKNKTSRRIEIQDDIGTHDKHTKNNH